MKRRYLLQEASAAIAMPGLSFERRYPVSLMRCVVPLSARGGSGTIDRVVTERRSKSLGQTIVVDNQSGALCRP
ncbi:hypothetical protein [Hydrogenophaga sp.]|uniref:hypothetical protein n=1 Tax=Hydrogenophaga sp. TaxID=1904254 RepID=UPI0025B969CD|nr:hypothetical protein [Hydrogenophaga sp.]MBT9463824.1 hypothetical protein [Hydrogenophaga sp.]